MAVGGITLVAGALLVVLAAAAWLARLGVVHTLWWVPAAWVVAVAVSATAVRLASRRFRSLGAFSLARYLEAGGSWRLGSLTGMLAAPATGLSADLFAAADQARAADLAARGPGALSAVGDGVRRYNRVGALALLVGTIGLLGAGPGRAPVRMLWHPAEALGLALGAVQLESSALAVDRGEAVSLTVRAPGRRAVTLWRRAPGETWRADEVQLDSLGEGRLSTGPLATDLFVRATSGGRESDTLHVTVRIPAFLGSLSVTALYPAYLGLEDELLDIGPDSILLPEGTRLLVEGEATAPLATAELLGPKGAIALVVEGGRFAGRAVPVASGAYRLALATASGSPLAGDDATLLLRIAPDSSPAVSIPVPGADTLAPLGLTVPLVIDAHDDHGLASVTIVSRRISRLGIEDPERREAVALPAGTPERVMVPFLLGLESRALLPGDTVRYFAVAVDNAPRPRTGRSREYILRLPTVAEMRAAERAATESVGAQLDALAAASRQLQRQTEDLSKEASRSGAENSGRREASSM